MARATRATCNVLIVQNRRKGEGGGGERGVRIRRRKLYRSFPFGATVSVFGTSLPIPYRGIARRTFLHRSILHLSASHDDHVIVIVRIRGRAAAKIILDRSAGEVREKTHECVKRNNEY